MRRRFSHHDDRDNKNETAGMTKNKNMARLRSSLSMIAQCSLQFSVFSILSFLLVCMASTCSVYGMYIVSMAGI